VKTQLQLINIILYIVILYYIILYYIILYYIILYYIKEKRGYWKFKEEAVDRTMWRTRFRKGYRPVVRHNYSKNEESRSNSGDSKQVNPERRSEV